MNSKTHLQSQSLEAEINRKISILQEDFHKQEANIEELDDPLTVFDSYCNQLNQLIQSTPPSFHKLITAILVPVLGSVTQMFSRDPRYKNDARYLKLWLGYAKYCREAEDIFGFLSQEGIAQNLATYYEEYAGLLIEKRDILKA